MIRASLARQATSSFPDLGQSLLHVHGLYVAADHLADGPSVRGMPLRWGLPSWQL